jgi:hypothetical protein
MTASFAFSSLLLNSAGDGTPVGQQRSVNEQ